jgi:hypothetical protein
MPTYGQTWSDVIVGSFQSLWGSFVRVVPTIVFALVILILGWIVALSLEQLIARLLKLVKLNEGLDRTGVLSAFKRAGMKVDVAALLGALVRWFVFFVFLMAVADVLNLDAFNAFLRQVLLYIPNIILAALILLVAAIGGDLLERLVAGSVRAAGFSYDAFVGAVARWSVFIFGVIAALQQLGIASALLQTIVTGIVAMVAIAGGLAFGLGGREMAADFLDKIRRRIS